MRTVSELFVLAAAAAIVLVGYKGGPSPIAALRGSSDRNGTPLPRGIERVVFCCFTREAAEPYGDSAKLGLA